MANTVDLFRRIVRQQTNQIGENVANLYGAVAAPVEGLQGEVISTWAKATIPGTVLPDIDDFYALWASQEPRVVTILTSKEGAILSTEPDSRVQLLRGTLNAATPMTVPLTIDVGSTTAEFAVYVDSVLQRRGSNALILPLQFDAGTHLIEVVALAQNVVLAVPPFVRIEGANDAPSRPRWDLVKSGWLDAKIGTPATELRWSIDRRAGGWRVMRRRLQFLTRIMSVGDADAGGIFSVILKGNVFLGIGDELHALQQTMGVVQSVLYDAVLLETSVTVRLAPDMKAPRRSWVGATATTGLFVEIRRVRRTASSGQVVQYDSDVITGEAYEYVLQAYGIFDETQVSPFSEAAYVRAGDLQAPGPIVFLTGFPKVSRGRATVRYRTPVDDDYSGTKVEFREKYSGTLSGASTSGATFSTNLLTGVTYAEGMKALVMAVPGGGAALNQMVKVTGFVGLNQITTEAWETIPPNGSTILLYIDRPIITDTGVPAVEDEVTFSTATYGPGEYLFRTFDFGGNTQDDRTAVLWEYDSAIDVDGLSFGITVREETSETATIGTLKLEVGDPDTRITKVEMRAKVGNSAWGPWTIVTGTALVPPKDKTKNYSYTVELTERAPSAIAYRIEAEDDKGVIDYVIEAVVPFSIGTKPGLPAIVITFTSAGKAQITLSGDSDTKNYKIAYSTTGQPTLVTTRAATASTNNSRNYSVLLPTSYVSGTTLYVSVLALSATGEESDLLTTRASRDGSNDIFVQEVTSETNNLGTLTLVIPDMNRVTKVEMRSQKGREEWGNWVDVTTTLTMNVAMEEKTTSFIAWRITGYDSLGGVGFLEQSVVPFRVGLKPMVPVCAGSFDALGRLVLTFQGDSDTDYFKYEVSSSAQPGAVSVRLQTPTTLGQRITTVTTVDRFQISQIVYVSAFGYNELPVVADVESEMLTAKFAREGLEEVRVEERVTETPIQGTLTLVITDPQNRVSLIEMRTKVGNDEWSLWQNKTVAKFITVPLAESKTSLIAYRLTGSDSTGNTLVLKESIVPFTSGNIPGIPQIDVSFNALGQPIIILTGDSDTSYFRYSLSPTAFPTEAVTAAEASTTALTRVYTTTGVSEFAIGDLLYITALAYSATNQKSVLGKGIFARQGLSDLVIQEVPTETATTGSLALIIRDPGLKVTLVEMRTRSGTGAWSAWDEVTGGALAGGTRTYTVDFPVTLVEGKTSAIGYRVSGYDATGDVTVLRENVVAFNTGVIPGVPDMYAGFDASGNVVVSVDGDSDTLSARALVSSTSQANDTALLATASVNGRQTVFAPVSPTFANGATAYVYAYAYSAAGGTGQRSPLKTLTITRALDTNTINLQVIADIQSSTADTVSVVITATDPTGGAAPAVSILSSVGIPGGTAGITGAGTSASPYVITRPTLGAGSGRVTFQGVKTGRTTDTDSIDVPEKGTSAVNLRCVARITGQTAGGVTVTVIATDPLGLLTPTITLENVDGIPGGAGAITGSNPFVIPRPAFQAGIGRVSFVASVTGRISDSDAVDIGEQQQDTNTVYTECQARIINSSGDTVTVEVTAVPSDSLVQLVSVTGGASRSTGLLPGVTGSGVQTWVFNRGNQLETGQAGGAGLGPGQAQFRATRTGYVADDDFVNIEQKGKDTKPLTIQAHVTTVSASQITVRVAVADPSPQSGTNYSLTYQATAAGAIAGFAVGAPSPSSGLDGAITANPLTTGGITYVITRPNAGQGSARVTFTGASTGEARMADTDSVDIPSQDNVGTDTVYCQCVAKITAVDAEKMTVEVSATPSDSLVQFIGLAALTTASKISGLAAGVTGVSPQTYVFQRGSFGQPFPYNGPGTIVLLSGDSQAQFRATKTGYISDDDFVEIPQKGRDTVPLTILARVTATSVNTVTVKVQLTDPQPQAVTGAYKVTANASPGSTGLAVSPGIATVTGVTSNFSTTGEVEFVITRPNAGQPQGRIVFNGYADEGVTNVTYRVNDVDAVDVPARETVTTPGKPTPFIDAGASTGTTQTLVCSVQTEARGATGAQLSWTLEYDVGDGNPQLITAGDGTLLPKTQSITRDMRYTKVIIFRVTDSVSGLFDEVYYDVTPRVSVYIDPDGTYRRANPFNDGKYTPRSPDSDGTRLDTGTNDFAGRGVLRMFAKANSGDADNLDGVPNGSSFRRVLLGGTDASGNLNFNGTAWVNKTAGFLPRSGLNATSLETIASRLADDGNAGSNLNDSTGIPLNRSFKKPNSGDPNDLDGIPNSISWRRTSINAVNGSGSIDFAGTAWVNKNAYNIDRNSYEAVTMGTVVSRLDNVGNADTTLSDSTGVPLNRSFKKPTSGDPNDLDGIPNSASWRRTSINAINGSGFIDFSGSAFVNKDAQSIGRSPVDATSVYAITSYLKTNGMLEPGMLDDTGIAVNRTFKKASTGTEDNLSGIPDGSVYRRVTLNAVNGSGQIDLASSGVVNKEVYINPPDLLSAGIYSSGPGGYAQANWSVAYAPDAEGYYIVVRFHVNGINVLTSGNITPSNQQYIDYPSLVGGDYLQCSVSLHNSGGVLKDSLNSRSYYIAASGGGGGGGGGGIEPY